MKKVIKVLKISLKDLRVLEAKGYTVILVDRPAVVHLPKASYSFKLF